MRSLTILSQYFQPSQSATAQLMTDLAKGFVRQGYNVSVFTGTQQDIGSESSAEMLVSRAFSLSSSSTSLFSKAIDSIFFLVGALFYILVQQSSQSPLLIASNPPYAGLIGMGFRFLKRGQYYFLLQDIFPESAVIAGFMSADSLPYNFFNWLNYCIVKNAKKVIVLNTSMKQYLEQKYPALKQKFVVIENWAIEDIPICEKQHNSFAKTYNLTNVFTVLYSGNLGRMHDIETIVEAAKLLKSYPIQFVFIGHGSKAKLVKAVIENYSLTNILLLPFQPRAMIPLSLTACDVSLISLVPGAEQLVAPSKLYGILASGRAVLAISRPDSSLCELLSCYNCGVQCPPESPQHLAQTILDLAADPSRVSALGKNARRLYREHYTFDRAFYEYEKLLFQDRVSQTTTSQSKTA